MEFDRYCLLFVRVLVYLFHVLVRILCSMGSTGATWDRNFAKPIGSQKALLPTIRKTGTPSLRQIGITMTGLGVYFALMLAIYIVIGGYYAHPTVWMEIIMPVRNPDWWCLSFLCLGPYLIAVSR